MKKIADFIDRHFATVKKLSVSFAAFATVFSITNTDCSPTDFAICYVAGAAAAVALLIFSEEDV